MVPGERRLIRRLMLVASALVALMLAATVWSVLRSHGPAASPPAGYAPGGAGGGGAGGTVP
jgi:hypothetical protein